MPKSSKFDIVWQPAERTTRANNKKDALEVAGKIISQGHEVQYIGGEVVVGGCEGCGLAILEGEKYWHDDDGIVWHKEDCS